MLKKSHQHGKVMVSSICIVIRGSLTGQRYVDEVLHPHVLPLYWTVGTIFLFQQDNAPIPAIWQGTICKLAMAYPLDWPSGIQIHLQSTTPGIIETVMYRTCIPPQLPHYQNWIASWFHNGNAFHRRVGGSNVYSGFF